MRTRRLVAAVTGTGLAIAVASAPSALAWAAGASPSARGGAASAPTGDRVLDDVVYSSADDAWAVGWRSPSYAERYAVILHGDGAGWTKSKTPPTGRGLAGLGGVTMISADDVWAVGSDHGHFEGGSSALAMHWDGADWTILRTPDPGFEDGLSAVSGTASDDVWAVGSTRPSVGVDYEPLIEHWDGSGWSTISAPDLPAAALTDVDAVAPNDVWAVGFGRSKAVALHYDGSHWTSVRVPEAGGIGNSFRSVSSLAADDIWAVGRQSDRDSGEGVLVEHWNGSRWKVVAAPSPGDTHNELMAVDARGPSDVWAVGKAASGSSYETLIEHWDGTSWTHVPSPPTSGEPGLDGVGSLSAHDALAVGNVIDQSGRLHPIIERWDGQRWHKSHPRWN